MSPFQDVHMHADVHSEVAAVRYEVNVLGTKGPRKMTAIMPAIDAESGRPLARAPSIHADNSIIERCCHASSAVLSPAVQACFLTVYPAMLQRVPVSTL